MSSKISFTVDGLTITANEEDTILKAALEHGIYIPHLCYHPELKPFGGCRLCIVEIKGRGLTISCKAVVEKGIVVITESPEINNVRRIAAELLIANHYTDCLQCVKNTECKLQSIAAYIGIDEKRLQRLKRVTKTLPIDDSNPFFIRDPNKCVLCGICVRTCEEIQGIGAIDFTFRGYATRVTTLKDKPIKESECESCGECVVRCPVGALVPRIIAKPAHEVKSICPYCGCGCGIYLGVRGNTIVNVRGDFNNPVNYGKLCVKGRFGINEFVHSIDRLTTPLVKKGGKFVAVSWDEALSLIAEKFSKYSDNEFAVIASAKCANEENYVIQKFVRTVMKTNNIDHCARLCHAPSVAGLTQTLGSGAMTNTIEEIAQARTILTIGTNTTATHPIIALQIKKAVTNGAKLIVINPKKIELCRFAYIWLRHKPGSDVALLSGIAKVIIDENLQDIEFIRNRCESYEEYVESLKKISLDEVEIITNVKKELIIQVARIYAIEKPGTILYGMGVTQHSHGTDNVFCISNLALLTGNIGKPSTGINPLRGQNNVQGACDMGLLPIVFPGYQRVDDPVVREKFERYYDTKLNPQPGLTITEIFEKAHNREIKAMYIIGENPILSEPCSKHAECALTELEFLVVQDLFLTETAKLADVILPACSFAEKDGTFTNTDRRVQLFHKAIEPIGESKPDWWIVCEIAKRMGKSGFDYNSTSEIMDEIAKLTPIYAGISHERLKNQVLQWPCTHKDHLGTPILHRDKFARGKGKFMTVFYKPSPEPPDDEFPFILTTERILYHYHGVLSRKVKGLNILMPEERIEINPQDANKLNIKDGELIKVISRSGKIEVKTRITENVAPGVLSMSFHFSEVPSNVLFSNTALDPVSKTPELKFCAVKIEKINRE